MTHDPRSMDELTADLRAHAAALEETSRSLGRVYAAKLAAIPAPGVELADLLEELAAADDDCRSHFQRHPRTQPQCDDGFDPVYGRAVDPAECKADWSRCCQRRENAFEALLQFGRVVREARSQEQAA